MGYLDNDGLKYYDGKMKTHVDSAIANGTSAKAKQLETARTIRTNLGSTSTASFDGTANVAPGVTGTLPIANGGTGATTAAGALTNLGLTATATELNYTDGVTSNIQTQLNAKAPLASPTLTGTPKAPTAAAGTNTTQIATTAFVQTALSNGIAASDAMIIKGTIGTNGTVTALPTTYKTGWTYRVVTAGTYAGQVCEIGDLIIALVDRSGSSNADSDWCVAQTNINGAITGIKSGDAYITVSQSGSVVTITHKDVTRSNTTSTAAPAHGGTFTAVDGVTSDSKGHVTGVNTKTVTLPAQYSHPSYTARTGVPTANQAPAFGGTFTVTQPVSDATGHITAMNSRTITIPSAVATQSAAGLQSAADKKKLDGIATGATANTGTITKVQANGTDVASSGTANIPAASTSAYGVTKLSSAINSTSTALAATASAVKSAYDRATNAASLIFSSKSVATSAWASDTTYTDYPYKATITCSGVTANHVPTVNFGLDDAISGNFAPVALSAANAVTIYAAEKPASAITIHSIVCVKGV